MNQHKKKLTYMGKGLSLLWILTGNRVAVDILASLIV